MQNCKAERKSWRKIGEAFQFVGLVGGLPSVLGSVYLSTKTHKIEWHVPGNTRLKTRMGETISYEEGKKLVEAKVNELENLYSEPPVNNQDFCKDFAVYLRHSTLSDGSVTWDVDLGGNEEMGMVHCLSEAAARELIDTIANAIKRARGY